MFLILSVFALERYGNPASFSSRANLDSRLPPRDSGVPPLPRTTLHIESTASTSPLNGSIVIACPIALHPEDWWYEVSTTFRRAHEAFSQWLVTERGGVQLNGGRYGVKFVYVGDGSSNRSFDAQHTPAAASAASRAPTVDFVLGGYTSDLNKLASQQSHAAGKLMMTFGAAATEVFTQNNLTFGLVTPARKFLYDGVLAIADAARREDELGTPSRCSATSGKRCVDNLVFGLIEANNSFGRGMCNETELAAAMTAANLTDVPEPSKLIKASVSTAPDDAEIDSVLRDFDTRGVNVILGCTYMVTVEAVVASLERVNYSPLAMVAYEGGKSADLVRKGWWQGDHLLFTVPVFGRAWKNGSTPGDFTGLTARDFLKHWGPGENAPHQSLYTGNFIALAVLMDAVERAQSVDSNAVAAALEQTQLREFWSVNDETISFDGNHQVSFSKPMGNILQGGNYEKKYEEHVIYPSRVATSSMRFPMPTWPQRRCQVLGVARRAYADTELSDLPEWWNRDECSGHGACNVEGTCDCDANWAGEECDQAALGPIGITLAALGSVFGLVVIVLCAIVCRKQYLRWRTAIAAQKAAEAARVQRIHDAVNCMQLLNFPLCVMRLSQFKALGKLVPHEEARDKGLLRILDRWEDAMAFATSNPICFNSHQWLGLTAPDPKNVHYPAMIQAGQALCRKHGLEEEELWVWVDFFSIPQLNKASQLSAINSIAVYASCCKFFLVCAIDTVHEDTEMPCNPASYSRRGWCRLEQWSFMGVHGVAHMYLLESAGRELVQLKEKRGWLKESIRVMDGSFTMESDKPKLVDAILGLYAFMKVSLVSGCPHLHELHELLKEHKEEVFPIEYFGGLEQLLEQELELARSGAGGGSAFSDKDFETVLLAREAFSRVQGRMLPEDLTRRLTQRSTSSHHSKSTALELGTLEAVAVEVGDVDAAITPSVSTRSSEGDTDVSRA